MPFSMSVKTLDYTPSWPTYPSLWMGGYCGAPRGNQGVVNRRLRAQCVVIDDGAGPKVMLRVDVVSIPRYVHQAIRTAVLSLVGNDNGRFLIICSHTHSGPMIGTTRPSPYVMMNLTAADISAIESTTTVFINQMIALVQQTVAMARTPVTLWYKEGSTTIGYNRAEEPNVLTTISALIARRTSDNGLHTVLFGYACHAVSRGNDNVFCSDYPGVATDVISNALGVQALFFQGAAGDQEPTDPHSPSQSTTLGTTLANAVVSMVNSGGWNAVNGPVSTFYNEIQIPLSVDFGDPAAVIRARNSYNGRLDTFPPDDFAYRHAEVMIDQINGAGLPKVFPMPIQRWNLGGLNILAMSHEVLSQYDVTLQSQTPGWLWIMAYANETEGYVAANGVLQAGEAKHFGYEAGWTDEDQMSGPGSWTNFYAWPAPLKFSPSGAAGPGTTERLVLDACTAMLNL
jgi:neutral ceramidase